MNKPIARGRLLVVCCILTGILLGLALTLYAITGSRHDQLAARTDALICARVNKLDGVIVALLERSQKSLPTNPFYEEHPELLADAQRQNARAIRDFRGATCLPERSDQ